MISGTIKSKSLLVFIATITLFTAHTSLAQSSEVLAKSTYLQAEENFKSKNFKKAIEYLDKTIVYLGESNARIEALYVKATKALNEFIEAEKHLALYFEMADESRNDYMEMVKLSSIIKEKAEAAKRSGKFTDPRDGKTYKTIKIGDQIWMAENLNYNYYSGSRSWCYENSSYNCKKYGRLYTWETAKSVCPKGWHLPSDKEWKILINYLGGEDVAGIKMKSTSGWKNGGNGTNDSGFSGVPGGSRYNDERKIKFVDVGVNGHWWSSTPYGTRNDIGNRFVLRNSSGTVKKGFYNLANSYSVRCLCN